MNRLLWVDQTHIDILHIGSAVLLALLLVLIFLVPGLWRVVQRSYRHSRTENLHEYISRYIPASIYARLLDVATAGTLALFAFEVSIRLNVLARPLTYLEAFSTLGGFTLCILVFYVLRRIHFELWRYVFMPPMPATYLLQDYLVIAIGSIWILYIWLIAAQSPINPTIWIWGGICTLVCKSIIRSLQTVRRLHQGRVQDVYIFLYLCTHEILPWVICLLMVALSSLQIF